MNMAKHLLSLFFFFMLSGWLQAQKLKYKDIFTMLNNKQYEAAEPFLKQYLNETKDNSNAYLFLGIIYEQKAVKGDVLRETDKILNYIDSAILLFNKTSSMINEKELKKQQEYYAMYSRTDLRTGTYGVKLSDVQYDLRKRVESLRERTDKVKMINYYFSISADTYNRSQALFRTIQEAYPGWRELYLRADQKLLEDLKILLARYDSAAKAYDNFRSSISNLERSGYNPVWKPRIIQDFKNDGKDPADFYSNEPVIWDYRRFAVETRARIEQEIISIRKDLITYDMEINKLAEKLRADSVSVYSDLTRLVQSMLSDKLRKFDPNPMPLQVLSVKVADLAYRSALMESRKYRDSADVFFQLELVQRELQALNKLDSVLSIIEKCDIDEESLNYADFVENTYNNAALLKSYIRAEQEFARNERTKVENRLAARAKAINWLIVGNDSIPIYENAPSPFKPLFISTKFTAGLWFDNKGKTEGYFYDVTPSRRPSIRVRFPVNATVYNLAQLQNIRAIVGSDAKEQIFFVLLINTTPVKDKFSATLAKIYRSDGLAWTVDHTLNFIPQSITYNPENGELRIDSGGTASVVTDKNGKIKPN